MLRSSINDKYFDSDVTINLSYFLSDCPICWQNFIKYLKDANYLNDDEFKNQLNSEGIIKYNDSNELNRTIIFDSNENLVKFKLKWS